MLMFKLRYSLELKKVCRNFDTPSCVFGMDIAFIERTLL